MMPTYAKVQDQQRRLGRAFLTVLEMVMSLALPLTVFMILAARQIVLGILGPKWEDAVVPLQIMAVAGFMRAVVATGGAVFLGTGRPHLPFWANLGRAAILLATVYPLTRSLGVPGTALSVTLGLLANLPVWARTLRITASSWSRIASRCIPGLLLGLLVAIGVCLAGTIAFRTPAAELLCRLAIVGVLTGAGAWLMRRFMQSGPFVNLGHPIAAPRDMPLSS